MITLSELCLLVGGLYIALHLPLVAGPSLSRRLLAAFPRNSIAGAILAAVALAWSAWNVNDMPLGLIDNFKMWLWVLAPVMYGLVLVFMNELLAIRALGGILMLAACPVLEIQRLNESYWAWVLASLAYLWVVSGMVLILSPYRFRHAMERCCSTDRSCRLIGAGGFMMGVFLIGLGLMVF